MHYYLHHPTKQHNPPESHHLTFRPLFLVLGVTVSHILRSKSNHIVLDVPALTPIYLFGGDAPPMGQVWSITSGLSYQRNVMLRLTCAPIVFGAFGSTTLVSTPRNATTMLTSTIPRRICGVSVTCTSCTMRFDRVVTTPSRMSGGAAERMRASERSWLIIWVV